MSKRNQLKQSAKPRTRKPIVDADRPIPLAPAVVADHIERVIPALGISVGRVRSLAVGGHLSEDSYSFEEMARDGGYVLYEEYGLMVIAVPRDEGEPRDDGQLVIAYEPRLRDSREGPPCSAVPHEVGYILPDGRFVDRIEWSLLDGGIREHADALRKVAS